MRRLFNLITLLLLVLPLSSAEASSPSSSEAATSNPAEYQTHIPTFSVISVVQNGEATIKTINFPKEIDFNVTMGVIKSKGIGGTVVGTQNSGAGGSFIASFPIPEDLYSEEIISIRLQSLSSGHYAYNWFYNTDGDVEPESAITSLPAGVYPTFDILNRVSNVSVTIRTQNLTAEDVYIVTMGLQGTNGVGGIIAASQETGPGGSLDATYTIPAELKGRNKISIRLASPLSGYYAYNIFENKLTAEEQALAESNGVKSLPAGVIPTFTIDQVIGGTSVTISGKNFTLNDTYTVLINDYGTLGVGGASIASQETGETGIFTATYEIPAGFQATPKIAIRLESDNTGYYSYNWFENTTILDEGGGAELMPAPALPPGIYPSIEITAVIEDDSVTIHGLNFTMNDSYSVLMGAAGTQGIGGIIASSFSTDETGEFTETFSIPLALQGTDEITVRFESLTTPYFAYNIFTNEDTTE